MKRVNALRYVDVDALLGYTGSVIGGIRFGGGLTTNTVTSLAARGGGASAGTAA
jgi:hypothetical protein